MVPPLVTTPSEVLQADLNERVRSILGEGYYNISITQLVLNEDVVEGHSRVSCDLRVGESHQEIRGYGKGIIDALWSGIMEALEENYSSLGELSLLDFAVEGDFEKTYNKRSNTDADVEVRLLIHSSNAEFVFRERSASMNTAAIKAVLKVIEHFVNSERAVEVIYDCIKDARSRSRGDLVDCYLRDLAELVRSVSYEKKIKDLLEARMECENEE